ncbi:peroxidasin homolog isoform X1 [Branchiostoma floridae x Branchiostoma japonicum]
MASVIRLLFCLLVISTLLVSGEATGGDLLDGLDHPGDVIAISAAHEAMSRVDNGNNRDKEMRNDPKREKTPSDFLALFHKLGRGAQREARRTEIVENIIRMVADGVKAKGKIGGRPVIRDMISRGVLDEVIEIASLSDCARSVSGTRCRRRTRKYRTIDGTCNNMQNQLWGSSITPFTRFLTPIYEDGFNEPVGWDTSLQYNGFTLPSVRHVSNELITTEQNVLDPDYTHMLTQWGQFLDHDIDLTATAVGRTIPMPGMNSTSCSETCDNIMPCFPIRIPDDDERITTKDCMPFTRSSAVCGTGETSTLFNNNPIARKQINQITSFIDASNVYGSTLDVAQSLRDLSNDDGLLRVQEGADISSGMDLLPFQDEVVSSCNQDPKGGDTIPCFLAGDVRSNEVNTLIASHTIWLREHNRIAKELKSINPRWDGETIYQEARKIVGAEMQHITYTEYLPKILGPAGMDQIGEYSKYNASVNPSTRNEFATAAFRFGHAAISGTVRRFDENYVEDPVIGNVALRDTFFSPWRIFNESGVDPVVRGLIGGSAKLVTPTNVMHEELSQGLFALKNQIALDLAALNTQRGRDHGLPFYNDWRVFCGLSRAETFSDLEDEIKDSTVRDKLTDVYGDVNNIDLWPAAQLEDHEDGARVGPTFRCMMAEQFKAFRDGDRFWYQSKGVFTKAQRAQLDKVTLARVICDNTGITRLPRDVFRLTDVDDMVACGDIAGMDLQAWRESRGGPRPSVRG